MAKKQIKKLTLATILLLFAHNVWAYDFEKDGIYYNKMGTKAVVTYKDDKYNSYSDTVIIPATVKWNSTTYTVYSIGASAFKNCNRLKSVTLPNSITEIGNNAFAGCGALESITIPNSVTTIGNGAFSACGLTSIVIPESINIIESSVFVRCKALTSVTLSNNITEIKWNAFGSCVALNCITIPNSVTTIGDDVFEFCTTLERVIIGANVTTIGSKAFYETALNQIVLLNDKPAALGNACFNSDNTTPLQPLIVVPYGTKNDYKSADGWKEFEYIIDGQTCAKIYTYIHATITNGETYSDYGFNESGAGTYTQTLQTADGCDSIITLYLQVTSSIDGVKQAEIITIYPNPAKTMLTIENATEDVQIFDITGRLLMNIDNKETNMLQINISHLSKGMYFVKIGNYTTKFVKE